MIKLGRVMEVFLPKDEESTKIGFKIKVDNEIITIIEKQNFDNAKIYRDDFVNVIIEMFDNEKRYSITSISDIELGDSEDE